MDAAFAAPHRHKGLSAAIPQIASLPGASPTFSRHGGAMLRIEGRSHAAHRGAEPCCAWTAALTRASLRPLSCCAVPSRTVRQRTSARLSVWNGRREFKGVGGGGDKFGYGGGRYLNLVVNPCSRRHVCSWGVKRTSLTSAQMSAFDPKRTSKAGHVTATGSNLETGIALGGRPTEQFRPSRPISTPLPPRANRPFLGRAQQR